MATPLTPEEEEKYAGYTRLTGDQFIEVMQTGKCEGYEAEVRDGFRGKTYTLDKIWIQTPVSIPDNIKFKVSIILNDNVYAFEFEIDGGNFENDFRISGGNFESYFSINGGNFENDFWIEGGNYESTFSINGGNFKNNFSINGGNFENDFWIEGGNFEYDSWVNGGDFGNCFWILGGNFEKYFNLLGGNFENDFWVNGGHFKNEFRINGGNFENCFLVTGGTFKNEFIINGGHFKNEFRINGGNFENEFRINGGNFEKFISILYVSDKPTTINTLHLATKEPSLSLSITKVNLKHLELHGVSKIETLRLIDIDLKASDSIQISNSSLSNLELIGCDWSAATLQVDNSNLMGIFYTDTLFPERITSSEKDTKKNIEQVRDTYSQLKTVAEKQNDRESSLYFQSKANDQIFQLQKTKLRGVANPRWKYIAFWRHNAIWRRLGWQKSVAAYTSIVYKKAINLTNYLAFWRKYWGEFLQLLLNKFSNDFGQSYLRAFVMLFACTGILFSFYVPSVVPELEWTWNPFDIPQGLSDGIRLYGDKFFYFINPIRKMGFLCPAGSCTDVHWLAAPIDWFSRIVIFYLSYQFVQAFRKYGRR